MRHSLGFTKNRKFHLAEFKNPNQQGGGQDSRSFLVMVVVMVAVFFGLQYFRAKNPNPQTVTPSAPAATQSAPAANAPQPGSSYSNRSRNRCRHSCCLDRARRQSHG